MTMNNGTYHYLSCNVPVSNLLYPTCRTVSDSVLDDRTAALEVALKGGWTENSGRHMCPEHSRGSVVVTAKPVAARRNSKPSAADVGAADSSS